MPRYAGVTWVHAYVSADNAKTFCVRRADSGGGQKTAARNDLPIDRITEVGALDPNFYIGGDS